MSVSRNKHCPEYTNTYHEHEPTIPATAAAAANCLRRGRSSRPLSASRSNGHRWIVFGLVQRTCSRAKFGQVCAEPSRCCSTGGRFAPNRRSADTPHCTEKKRHKPTFTWMLFPLSVFIDLPPRIVCPYRINSEKLPNYRHSYSELTDCRIVWNKCGASRVVAQNG